SDKVAVSPFPDPNHRIGECWRARVRSWMSLPRTTLRPFRLSYVHGARPGGHAMVGYSFGELRQSYARLWNAMEIPPGIRVRSTDSRVTAIATGKSRYDQVANATG